MSEVKKIATRESYGETLVELGAEHEEIVVLARILRLRQKQVYFRLHIPNVSSTAVSRKVI